MSYDGWFTLDGAEFANASRFAAYAAHLWRPDTADLALGIAQGVTYTDPATDLAPWYDVDEPISASFYGFQPLAVTGMEDSSRAGDVVENTGDGGVPGRIRHATKEVVFSGILAGAGEEACEFGMRWLRRTLLGAVCSPLDAREQAMGAELQYLGADPLVGDMEAGSEVLERLLRVRRRAAVTRGPVQTTKKRLTCGDVMWAVSFTVTIGDPYAYGGTKRIFTDLFGGTFNWSTDPVGEFTAAATLNEALCGDPVYQPLYDPTCLTMLTPPTLPNVPLGCWTPPVADEVWKRAWLRIPANQFPTWEEMLPIITITNTSGSDLRDLRLRFFPDELGDFDPMDDDPCSFVSDIVVSYMPQGTMTIDAVAQDVHHVTAVGTTRRADSLVFSTAMRPITWPVLACGVGYVLAVDHRTSTLPAGITIDLDLVPKQV